MVSFIMLHAQLYFLFVFDFPEMVAPYLKCIFVWGSIKFLFLFLFLLISCYLLEYVLIHYDDLSTESIEAVRNNSIKNSE